MEYWRTQTWTHWCLSSPGQAAVVVVIIVFLLTYYYYYCILFVILLYTVWLEVKVGSKYEQIKISFYSTTLLVFVNVFLFFFLCLNQFFPFGEVDRVKVNVISPILRWGWTLVILKRSFSHEKKLVWNVNVRGKRSRHWGKFIWKCRQNFNFNTFDAAQ